MDSKPVSQYAYPIDPARVQRGIASFDQPDDVTLRLSERVSLITVVLLSLGLWAGLWAVVTALVSRASG